MKAPSVRPVRCGIYTRVSTEHGLDQEFNSLDAQYDAASAYIKSLAHAGWTLIRSRYDDGGSCCKCGRILCPNPAAGNGIFGCGDRPPNIAAKMGERSQRQKSGK